VSLDKIIAELKNYTPTEDDLHPRIPGELVKPEHENVPVVVMRRPAVSAIDCQPAKSFICPDCGTIGLPKTVTKGSFLIEVALWLFLFFPGVIYSLWRLTTRSKACRTCGLGNIIPLHSPMGRKIFESLYAGNY
jgi:uncharacterized membrane protein YqaE (UPF0057 family)